MEIIHAKEAYANAMLAKYQARRSMFERAAAAFNKIVIEAADRGEIAALLRWRDFDIDEELAVDEEALTELLNQIVASGYDAEFCYCSPVAFNPCGIVFAWGEYTLDAINEVFQNLTGEIYRGE